MHLCTNDYLKFQIMSSIIPFGCLFSVVTMNKSLPSFFCNRTLLNPWWEASSYNLYRSGRINTSEVVKCSFNSRKLTSQFSVQAKGWSFLVSYVNGATNFAKDTISQTKRHSTWYNKWICNSSKNLKNLKHNQKGLNMWYFTS